jgi:mono/diheme cytochrome c family protein
MNRSSFVGAAVVFAIVIGSALMLRGIVVAQSNRSSETTQPNRSDRNESRIARGKYIVEGIAVCGQCHTPRNTQGDLDHTRWLEGAPLWLQPSAPSTNWPIAAPRLAGSPPGSDADLITLLTTGVWQNGQRLRPPMPVFHMSTEDAEAVVAYLRSLSPPYTVR